MKLTKTKPSTEAEILGHHFPNMFEAWLGLNAWWFNNFEELNKMGGGRYGSELFMPNLYFHCGYGKLPGDFDLAKVLGYTSTKWNTLITNYLSLNGVHEVRRLVKEKEEANKSNYNIVMMFTNNYKNGKGCLISLQFSRRPRSKERVVTLSTRATEITKRLIFDFLLIQRVADYVYKGMDIKYNVQFFSPHVYQCAESFVLMTKYKDLNWWNVNDKPVGIWQDRVHMMHDKYMDSERAGKMKMMSHVKTAQHLRGDKNVKPLLIKDLRLFYTKKELKKLKKENNSEYNNYLKRVAKMKLVPCAILK